MINPRSEADWAAAASWAEEADTEPATAARVLRGPEAAAHGRALLEAALGGPEAVEGPSGADPSSTPAPPAGSTRANAGSVYPPSSTLHSRTSPQSSSAAPARSSVTLVPPT